MTDPCEQPTRDDQRELAAARDLNLEAAAMFEALGDRRYALLARHNATWIHGDLGDKDAERRGHEENLAVAREIGNQSIEADALAQLGMSARDEGRLDDAADLLRDALRLERHLGMPLFMANQLGRLASVIARQGNMEVAARLVGAARAVEQQIGSEEPWWGTARREETMGLLNAGLGASRTHELLATGPAFPSMRRSTWLSRRSSPLCGGPSRPGPARAAYVGRLYRPSTGRRMHPAACLGHHRPPRWPTHSSPSIKPPTDRRYIHLPNRALAALTDPQRAAAQRRGRPRTGVRRDRVASSR